MIWMNFGELAAGAATIVVAVIFGRALYRISRRNSDSVLVHEGMLGDMICVVEVMLVVIGPLLLIRALVGAM